jgi:hypothetical protein
MTVSPHGVHVASELGAYVLAPDFGTARRSATPCPSSRRTTYTSGHVGTPIARLAVPLEEVLAGDDLAEPRPMERIAEPSFTTTEPGPEHQCVALTLSLSGSSTSSDVPAAGSLCSLMEPPSASTRSLSPTRPEP